MNQPASDSEDFHRACGSGSIHLLIKSPLGSEQRQFADPFAVIGRNRHADWGAGQSFLHYRQAYIQVIGGRAVCVDLAGQVPDTAEAPQYCWLGSGKTLRVGRLAVKELAGPSLPGTVDTLTESPFADVDTLPETTLTFSRSHSLPSFQCRRPLTLIGRSPACPVRLDDRLVSWYHCVVVNTPLGAWVVDLCGRGGTAVNGTPVRAARLTDRDNLRVGKFGGLRVRCGQPQPIPGDQATAAWSLKPTERPRSLPVAAPELGLAIGPAFWASMPQHSPALPGSPHPFAIQLAQLQQMMFDQFQTAMMEMVRTVSAMHLDQVRLIEQELSRVQQLTRELSELQAELARNPLPAGAVQRTAQVYSAAPAPPPAPDVPPIPDIHERLSRRVAAVQEEHKNTWLGLRRLLRGDKLDRNPTGPITGPSEPRK